MDTSDAIMPTDAHAVTGLSTRVPAKERATSEGHASEARPESLSRRLGAIAARVKKADGRSAERLEELGRILDGGEVDHVSTIDLYGAINPAGIQESAFEVAQQRPTWLLAVEWVRNVLVLVPLCLTWWGLWRAAANYRELLDLDPARIAEPFLLLWERGFAPLENATGPTFSEVAFWDLVILGCVLLLTVFVHRWRDVKEPQAEAQARELRQAVEAVLWDVDKSLAAARHSQTPDAVAAELVKNMRAEQQHLRDLADARLKEAERLSGLGDRLSDGATALQEFSTSVTTVYEPLRTTMDELSRRVHAMGDQQTAWTGQVEAISAQLEGWSRSVESAAEDLMQAAGTVGTSTTKIADYAAMSASTTIKGREMLESLTVRLDEVAGGLRTATGEAVELTKQLDQTTHVVALRLEEAAGKLAGTAGQFEGVGKVVFPALSTIPDQAARLAEQVRAVSGQVERSAAAFQSAAARMESSVNQVADVSAATAASLADLTGGFESVVGQVEAVTAELRKATHQAQTYTQSTWDVMEALRQTSQELAPALNAFSNQTMASLEALAARTAGSLEAFSTHANATLDAMAKQNAESHRQLAAALHKVQGAAGRGGARRPVFEWLVAGVALFMLALMCLVTTASALGLFDQIHLVP